MLVAVPCLLAFPGSASAHLSGTYGVDDFTQLLTLDVNSDEAGDRIALGCRNDRVTLNGQTIVLNSGFSVACGGDNGPEAIGIYDEGGNDTIIMTGVTRPAGFTNIARSSEGGFGSDEIVVEAGPGNDSVTGGPLNERINALFAFEFGVGADTITGGLGDDEIKGTEGKDKVFGGPGVDLLEPGPGRDLAHGGPGKDAIDEQPIDRQHDDLFGDGGRDQIFGGGGGDLIDGGPGGDYMDGQNGADRILGRAGDDGLFGGPQGDALFGHQGDDYIRGGGGRDKLVPGPGRDNVKQ